MITIVRKHFSIDHPSDIYTPITDPSKSCQLCISHWKAQLIYFVKYIIVGLFCLNSFQSSWGCSSVGRVCLQCIKPWIQIPALKRWRLEDQKLKAIIGCIVISEWATWNCLKNKKTMGLDTSGQDRSLHLLDSLLLFCRFFPFVLTRPLAFGWCHSHPKWVPCLLWWVILVIYLTRSEFN